MKKCRLLPIVFGFVLWVIPAVLHAQYLTYTWDIDGATPGLGTAPRAGNWDNVTANWTTNAGGSFATFVFPGDTWTTGDNQPDRVFFRPTTTQFVPGTFAAPDVHVNVVGTQNVERLIVEYGAYVILTNGAIRCSPSGGGQHIVRGGDFSAFNTVHVFSDIVVGPESATPSGGARQVTLGAGNAGHTASSNNVTIIEGSVYSSMTNRTDFFLNSVGGVTGAGTKLVLSPTSVISNGLAMAMNLELGTRVATSAQIGRIEIYSTNTFVGGSSVMGGKTVLYVDALNNQAGALGVSSASINFGGALISSANRAELLTGTSGVTVARAINVIRGANSNTTYAAYIGGEHTSGISTFSGGITLSGSVETQRLTDVHLTAAAGGTVRFTGNIISGTGLGDTPLNKVGLGTVELAGTANTYSGPTKVTEGTLLVTGQTGTGAVTVASGATLGGNGSIRGHATVNGTLSPGLSVGDLVFEGNLTLASGSTSLFEISGRLLGQYDQVQLTATAPQTITINSGALLDLDVTGSASALVGDIIWLFLNEGGTTTGNFFDMAQGSYVDNFYGQDWHISYQANKNSGLTTGGSDIALYAIPEPGTLGIHGFGLIAVGLRRRLRRA
ncbi:MAG: autotransporter-associated beta strand repeat-containing protein [Kiritimatiellia bacterium]|nr:autotransporter-associated beta strand repeat-containing protein [Kiritimatiellia bacterium]